MSSDKIKKRPPARTAEEREKQLTALAYDRAEQQLLEGTASSQVITHFLKLGSQRELLEKEKLRQENELLIAKTETIKAQKRVDELYIAALDAMKSYSGKNNEEEDENY